MHDDSRVDRNVVDTSKEQRRPFGRAGLVVDWVMIALLLANLAWLVLDSLLRNSAAVYAFASEHLGRPFELYEVYVHDNFALVDLAFVGVFLAEFVVRWAIAVRRHTDHRWFFYPLIHWYDVVGCIPIGSFRALRLLRLFAIVHRMHRQGLIDITESYPYRLFAKYRDIVTEEVSDRVVVRVLDGVQDEMSHGTPVVERIWEEVVRRRKDEISDRLTERTELVVRHTLEQRREALHEYVDEVLNDALGRSQHAFQTVHLIPVFGETFVRQIEEAIRVIVNNVIARLVEDAQHLDLHVVTDEIERTVAEAFDARDLRMATLVRETVNQSLEIIKDQVKVQQWKLREATEAAEREAAAG